MRKECESALIQVLKFFRICPLCDKDASFFIPEIRKNWKEFAELCPRCLNRETKDKK